MLQRLFSRAKRFFVAPPAPKPVWNEMTHLETLWATRSPHSVRRLGIAWSAMQTLSECKHVFRGHLEYIHLPFSGRDVCSDVDCLGDLVRGMANRSIVGDIKEVSYLFGKRLPIGYVIESDNATGLQKEIIESCERSLTVLRLYGRIVSAYPSCIIRMESRGGINIC